MEIAENGRKGKTGATGRWAMAMLALAMGVAGAEETAPSSKVQMERTVITPTRSEAPIAETAPAVSVITHEDLQRKQVTTVADALREIPGIVVAESGSRGSATSIFLRGADPDQTLVLIDGIEVNSTTAGAYDFADLTPENIERIEVLRGWGGTLYGSEAIGGVIQIFTREGSGPPRGSVWVSGGNGSTDREVAEFSGRSGIFSYSGSASHLHTDGFKPENDDYENTAVSGRIDAHVTDDATARVVIRAGESEFGNFFSNNILAGPDPNARQETDSLATRGEWSHAWSRILRYRVGASYSRQNVDFLDPADPFETASLESEFLSEKIGGDAQTNLLWWRDAGESTFGIEIEENTAEVESIFSDPSFGDFPSAYDEGVRTVSGYTLHQLRLLERRLSLVGGVRVDDNERFGQAVSPAGGASFLIAATATRLRATYAEGFKAPTLNELFFPGFGNPDLDPETSSEVTVGADQALPGDWGTVAASWFHRDVDDLIEGVPQESGLFLAENVGEATIEGVEATLDVALGSGVFAGGEYTFLDVDASTAGRVRRPKHSGGLHASAARDELWWPGDSLIGDARLLLVGSRLDFDPGLFFAPTENRAYQRADLALAYTVPSAWAVVRRIGAFVRVENLFDREYQEILGFDARPVNFLAGIKGDLG
jgi:vitamin B12 transporter